MSGVERIIEWRVLPQGLDEDDINAHVFAVSVKYRGPFDGKHGGGWSVSNGPSELSRGGSWTYCVPRFRRWQHRWESFEEAQAKAREVVDSVRLNGRTWAEFQAMRRPA